MSTARALLLVGAAAVALAWAAPARAADAPCSPVCPPPKPPRVFATAGFLPGVPLEDDRGDVSVARYAVDLQGERRLGARWKATWGFGVQRADYRFEDADRLVPGDGRLLDEAWRVSVAPGVSWDATDDWRLSAAFGVTATFAPGADVLDATTGSVLATVRRDGIEARGGSWSADEEAAFRKPILEQYEHQGHPYFASARIWDDGVIDPADTRRVLALALSASLNAPIPEPRFGVFRM